ncbi:MAG: S-methyl-5-thioribose-1-phosphate isomerase, partial [Rubrivivax sp.]
MLVNGQARRCLWPAPQRDALFVIDQRALPHRFCIERLDSALAVHAAIRDMCVRGAPLIGATAAYGLALQARHDASDAGLQSAARLLASARPTAVNLAWALQRMG